MADDNEFPSLDEKHDYPHGWIQWKGTDVCMDLHCECGFRGHYDGDFCYHIKCPECGQVYECGGFIRLHKLEFEPDSTKIMEG